MNNLVWPKAARDLFEYLLIIVLMTGKGISFKIIPALPPKR